MVFIFSLSILPSRAMRDDKAADAVDRLLENDPELHQLSQVLREHEKRLKKAMGPEAFRIYLDLEATANARLGELGERAWRAGRRSQ